MNEKNALLAIAEELSATETRLTAETTVLRLAVRALMLTSPQPEKALLAYEVLCEQHISTLLGSGVQNARCDALQAAAGDLKELLKGALAQRQASGS